MREENTGYRARKEIRLSSLRKQDLLQAEDKSEKSEGSVIEMSQKEDKEKEKAIEQEKKIREFQILDQNLQHILLQRQAFQIELRETREALKELEKSGEEIFKVVGQLMIKTDKKTMKEEMANKEKILDLKIKHLDSQEQAFSERLEKLHQEFSENQE